MWWSVDFQWNSAIFSMFITNWPLKSKDIYSIYFEHTVRELSRKTDHRCSDIYVPHPGFGSFNAIAYQSLTANDFIHYVAGVVHTGRTHLFLSLQWRHNGRNSVSNQRRLECLLNHLFRLRSKKTSKLRFTGFCEGNSPLTLGQASMNSITIGSSNGLSPIRRQATA